MIFTAMSDFKTPSGCYSGVNAVWRYYSHPARYKCCNVCTRLWFTKIHFVGNWMRVETVVALISCCKNLETFKGTATTELCCGRAHSTMQLVNLAATDRNCHQILKVLVGYWAIERPKAILVRTFAKDMFCQILTIGLERQTM